MPDSLLICLFLLLVFAPCVAALLGGGAAEDTFPDELFGDNWRRPRLHGVLPAAQRAMLTEVPLSEKFEIRSFAKGLAQRRLVIRDGESGVKLTIAQVRAAAVELAKLGGEIAAYELALVAAAGAAAMTTVRDAVAMAAREALESARNAYAWFAWGDGSDADRALCWLPNQRPPELRCEPVAMPWREATRAA
jgi:hypothetical protein